MNLPAPVLAALIAAFVALIGTVINFSSSLIGLWYTRNTKLSDWLFERRVSDSEELIGFLSGFIMTFEQLNTEVSQICSSTLGTIADAQSVIEGADKSFLTETFVVEKQRRLYEKALDLDSKLIEKARTTRSFIDFDLTRLTVWFDETDQTKEWIIDLYAKYNHTINEYYEVVIPVKQWARDKRVYFDKSFIEESEKIWRLASDTSMPKQKNEIVEETARIQRAIAAKYINSSVTLVDFLKDGLLKSGKR